MKDTIFKLFAVLCLLTSGTNLCWGDYKVTPKSEKPALSAALKGVKGYTVAQISNGQDMVGYSSWPFIDAYFKKEIDLWMSRICPDARAGENYGVPSCGNVQIAAKYNHNGSYAYNGVYYWNVGSFVIEMIFGDREYVYQYKLPAFSVQGNYFGDHTLSNSLMRNICQYVCHYDRNATLRLVKVRTGWTEAELKKYFDQEGNGIEGIYESTRANIDGHTSKYKLALKKNNNPEYEHAYDLIYLGGVNAYRDWEEGEIKAYLYPTSTPGIYKANWAMRNKTLNTNYYVTLKEGAFIVTDATSSEELYLQLYPTEQNRKPKQPESWSGSGFALNNGYVVTNYHVANNAKTIIVYQVKDDGSRQGYNATMVAHDEANDIAILKISDNNFKGFGSIPYKIKSGMCDVGEAVWALGYPMTDIMGDEVKFTDGKISARSGIDGKSNVYQISVPIQPGNSGGPLFDTKGYIVGITSSGLNRELLQTENVNYAIKISYLKTLISNSLPASVIPQGTAMQGQSLTTQIKLAKKFVFFIECNAGGSGQASTTSPSPSKPSTPSNPSNPSPSRPTLTPTEAMRIIQGNGASNKEDAFDALLWWAQHGDAEAYGYLGICYEFGFYDKKDITKAIEWFKKGANGDDPVSLHELGVFYSDGEGVEKDMAKAKDCFMRAAKKNYVASYSALGELLFAEKDTIKALEYLEKGVVAHSESAYYLMLNYYLFDKRNPEAAYTYLEMEMFDREQGTIVDSYRENGYRFEYYMGYYYEYGLPPMSLDLNKAKEWYKKAADHGDRDSKEKLNKLNSQGVSRPQNSWIFPKCTKNDDDILLFEIDVKENATVLMFSYYNSTQKKNGWVNISKDVYIEDVQTHKKYYLHKTDGIAIDPQKTPIKYEGTVSFSLFFDKIPDNCSLINFIEPGKKGWKLHNIELK